MEDKNELVNLSPLKRKAVRKAMNYAINKQQLIMYLRNSIGFAANNGFIPYGLPGFSMVNKNAFTYNPEYARKILDSIQYSKENHSIKLLTIPVYADVASFIAKQCELVGLHVQVEVVQKSLLLEQTAKGKALFFRGSWIADYPDPENYLAVFYSKNPAPPNYTRYANPKFDILYEKALEESKDSLRMALYKAMDDMIMEDLPVIPIWYDMIIHIVNNKIINFKPNAQNLLELRRVAITN